MFGAIAEHKVWSAGRRPVQPRRLRSPHGKQVLGFGPTGGSAETGRRGYVFSVLAAPVAQTCSLSVSVRIVAGRDDLAERGSVSRNRAGVLPALDLLALAHSNSLLGDLVTLNNLFVLQNCVLGITPFSIGPGQ